MKIELSARRGTRRDVHIFADVFIETASGVNLTAVPATFRVVEKFYEPTDNYDAVKGALLTVPVETAKELAEQILKMCS